MAIEKRIASNALIATAAKVLGGVFGFAATALIARILRPEGFGEYATVLAFLYMFQAVADLGLYATLVREISRPESDERKLVSDLFTIRIMALAILLSVGVIVLSLVPHYSPAVKHGAPIAALFYFFLAGSQVLMGVFQKRLAVFWTALAEIISRVMQFLLVLALYLHGGTLFTVLGAAAAAAGAHFFLTLIFARRFVPFGLSFSPVRWRSLLAITFPIGISLVFTLLYFRADTVLLSVLKPARDVGIYNLAYKVLENVIFFPAMLVGLVMPLLSNTAVRDPERFRAIFRKTFDILAVFAVPLVVGGFFLARPLILLLGGSEAFLDAVVPLKMLLVATGLIFFGSLFGSAVIALDQQRPAMLVYFLGMLFNVSANLIFIPHFSYLAAAATTVITECLVTLGLLALVTKKTSTLPSLYIFRKVALAALILGFFLAMTTEPLFAKMGTPSLLPLIVFGSLAYFTALLLLGGIPKEHISLLLRRS